MEVEFCAPDGVGECSCRKFCADPIAERCERFAEAQQQRSGTTPLCAEASSAAPRRPAFASVVLTLPYPISANRYWATRTIPAKGARKAMAMTYVTPEAKAFKQQVEQHARAAGVTQPIKGRVQLEIKLYPHRPLDWQKRMRLAGAAWDDSVQCIDLGNAEKVLSDALKDVVMEDDKWIRRIVSERMEPDGEARVVVTVTALAVEQLQAALI